MRRVRLLRLARGADDGRRVPDADRGDRGCAPRQQPRGGVARPGDNRPPARRDCIRSRAAGLDPPTAQPGAPRLDKALRAIRRDKRHDAAARKRPADSDVLRDMLRAVSGDSLRAHRARALLAIGMASAFRHSELVAITVAHVAEDERGSPLASLLQDRPRRTRT